MKLSKLARDLYEEIAELPVIDAHQHLPAEAEYLGFQYCGPNMFAGGYIQHDLESAGMSPAFKATMRQGGGRPVDEWWPQIKPHWENVRHTSYSRALRITARDLFGLDRIDDSTIAALSERVKADNTPGLYRRILQEQCGARLSITCVEQTDFPDDPGLRGLSMRMMRVFGAPVRQTAEAAGGEPGSLEEFGAALQDALRRDHAAKAVGFKIRVFPFGPPDPAAAAAFGVARESDQPVAQYPALRDYLFRKGLETAAELGIPVAVHTGYWGDFRQLDPKFMLGVAPQHPEVHFDVFHLGMPMIRDACLIGKSCPNVSLNLTWCPIISQVQTRRALDEILDLVPVNKVIAFGGDYRASVQKTWGHLVMARECVAAALATRLEGGEMDRAEAMRIAALWFHDNAARIYDL